MKFQTMVSVLLVAMSSVNSYAESYTQVGPIEDVSYAGIKRIAARIKVVDNLSREELEQTLTTAVRDLALQYDADAAMVLAYRSVDRDIETSAWTVGQSVYAPNGNWADAALSSAKRVTLEIGELYFQNDPVAPPKKGALVSLVSSDDTVIGISRSRDAWTPDLIVAEVPSGTLASVLERYEKAYSSEFVFVRYRVQVNHLGTQVEGWVDGEKVDPVSEDATL